MNKTAECVTHGIFTPACNHSHAKCAACCRVERIALGEHTPSDAGMD